MNLDKRLLSFLLPCALCLASCSTIDLYEKSVALPGHAWKSSNKLVFSFTIKDTSSPYQLFLILRHKDSYNYNNIYINVHIRVPGSDSVRIIRRDLTLATDAEGWIDAAGMDDIYEHRIRLGEPELLNAGNYTFTIEHIMREDPLKNVLNVGLRVEKKQ